MLGSLPALIRGQYGFLDRTFADAGRIFELDLGVTKLVVVADVEAAEAVLVRRARNYDKGGDFWDGARELTGLGLTASEGELWRRQRRLMQPKFQREMVESYREMIEKTVGSMVDDLSGDEPVDVAAWADELLSILSVRVLLGAEVEMSRVHEMRAALSVILDSLFLGMVFRRLPGWVPRPGRARTVRARDTVERNLLRMIAKSRRRGPGKDLLSALIHATDEQGSMSDQQLLDEAIVIFGAGYETTAGTLAWTLWLLARHPDILAELQRELAESETQPLLHACICEGLRLYPPGALIPRRTVADDELGGYTVHAGTTVLVAPWLIHRDPKLWPRPGAFDPQRFMPGTPTQDRPRMAWIPFGAGQRLCIGKALALMELEIALGQILTRYTPIVADDGPPPEPKLAATLEPSKPILLTLRPRS